MKQALLVVLGALLVLLGALAAVFFSVLADGERGMFSGPKLVGGGIAAIGIGLIVVVCVNWIRASGRS